MEEAFDNLELSSKKYEMVRGGRACPFQTVTRSSEISYRLSIYRFII